MLCENEADQPCNSSSDFGPGITPSNLPAEPVVGSAGKF